MGQIGSWFAPQFPDALIVQHWRGGTFCGPNGRQWFFSLQGVTERENRQQRIDAIMPTFIEIVRYWREKSGVSPLATALIGFSGGRLCRWRVSKRRGSRLRGSSPLMAAMRRCRETATTATTIHLIHGGEDRVIDLAWAVSAEEALQQAGGDVTLDIVDDLGHAVDDRSMQLAIERLRYTVPKHYFDEALSGEYAQRG